MKIIDIKDMPGFNPMVPNGIDSVSTGRVFLDDSFAGYQEPWAGNWAVKKWVTTPHCHFHGAMNKVSHDGIWRCLAYGCSCGCFQLP